MTVTTDERSLVNPISYARTRAELGDSFVRILGYFREDGQKSLVAIEAAMRGSSSTGLVIPAHTLKGESRQFGAEPLAELAETIEMTARDCVERQEAPDQLLEQVVALRPLFNATLAVLEREANPVPLRRSGGFGRRAVV